MVSPTSGVAGHYGTWTVTYTADESIVQGGAIRVQLPDAWHAGIRNSANRLQATNPTGDHYISARSSNPDVKLRTIVEGESDRWLVKGFRQGLDGRAERYVFVVRVEVLEGRIQSGDRIEVIYGDTSQGSRGMLAGVISTGPEPVLVAVDNNGNGEFQVLPDKPELTITSGPPEQFYVRGPSTLVQNEPAQLNLSVVDAHFNPVEDFAGPVVLKVLQGNLSLPDTVHLDFQDGWSSIEFTPQDEGIVRVKATARDELFKATSNPMQVFDELPERQIYWGDLHSHSRYSHDGVGRDPFPYARHIARLDFYAMTDHHFAPLDGFTRGLSDADWPDYTALTEKYNAAGEFATLQAYEASFGRPYGHHNVYFRGEPGAFLTPHRVSLPEMWAELKAGNALTIPHHAGKFPQPVLWDHHDPALRRNFELYSGHGLSEAFDPDHPLAFEQSDFTSPSESVRGPQFAQDAWATGLELSTIASSDDHRAQPGKPHYGLVAVQASELTRESVFDALHDRYTYATTGARILLDFNVAGKPMGQRVIINGPPLLEIEAHGTDVIDLVEVLRYSRLKGAFEIAYSFRPESMDVSWSRVDEDFAGDAIYYVRLRQRGEVLGRIAMAWSSPVWVEGWEE